ncbi:radical SAM protein [Candidatus Omnitrophota bacterium]
MEKDTFYFQWHITNVCNLRCRHCYQDDFTSQGELSWPQLKKVADNIITTLKTWRKSALITVTGGEPLIKKESFALLGYLNDSTHVKELNIITNATLLDEKTVSDLRLIPKLKRVKFSLEGITAQTNDSIRGEGSFKRIMNALEILKKHSHVKTHLMFTLLRNNIKEIPQVFNFCRQHRIEGVILERFIPIGKGKALRKEVLTRDDWKEVTDLLMEFCQIDADQTALLSQRAFWVRFPKDSAPELLGAPCTVSCDGLCIMPDATVFPCRRFAVPIGNLLTQGLDEIWQTSEVLHNVKKKSNLEGKCKTCAVDECKGCRALAHALTGNYLAEDSQCWLP